MSGGYTNGKRVAGILKKLLENRRLAVLHLKVADEWVRRPEPSIEVLRKQGWNIDTWRVPKDQGKVSVYFLNKDPRDLLDLGYTPLFMSSGRVALDVRQASRELLLKVFIERTGDQEKGEAA